MGSMEKSLDFEGLGTWKTYQISLSGASFGWMVPAIAFVDPVDGINWVGVGLLALWFCFVGATLWRWHKLLRVYSLANSFAVEEWINFVTSEERARWVREMLFRRLKRGGDGWTELMLVSYWDSDDCASLIEYRSAFEELGQLLFESKNEAARSVWKGVVYSLPAIAAFLIAWGVIAWVPGKGLGWSLFIMKWLLGFVAVYLILLALFTRNKVSAVTLVRREIFRGLPDDVLALTWGVQPLGLGAATVIHERCGGDRALIRERMAAANLHLKRWGNRDYL
jgi:hypothetical protein